MSLSPPTCRPFVSSVNDLSHPTCRAYLGKVRSLSRTELENLAAQAMFHLQCVSGSRNSFQGDLPPFPGRSPEVEAMHRQAAEFISKHGV